MNSDDFEEIIVLGLAVLFLVVVAVTIFMGAA